MVVLLLQVTDMRAPDPAEPPLARVMADTADARGELARTVCDNPSRRAQAEDADRRFERMQQAFERRFGHRWTGIGPEQGRGACDLPAAFGRTLADYENSLNRLEASFAGR